MTWSETSLRVLVAILFAIALGAAAGLPLGVATRLRWGLAPAGVLLMTVPVPLIFTQLVPLGLMTGWIAAWILLALADGVAEKHTAPTQNATAPPGLAHNTLTRLGTWGADVLPAKARRLHELLLIGAGIAVGYHARVSVQLHPALSPVPSWLLFSVWPLGALAITAWLQSGPKPLHHQVFGLAGCRLALVLLGLALLRVVIAGRWDVWFLPQPWAATGFAVLLLAAAVLPRLGGEKIRLTAGRWWAEYLPLMSVWAVALLTLGLYGDAGPVLPLLIALLIALLLAGQSRSAIWLAGAAVLVVLALVALGADFRAANRLRIWLSSQEMMFAQVHLCRYAVAAGGWVGRGSLCLVGGPPHRMTPSISYARSDTFIPGLAEHHGVELVFVFVAVQLTLLGSYLWYATRSRDQRTTYWLIAAATYHVISLGLCALWPIGRLPVVGLAVPNASFGVWAGAFYASVAGVAASLVSFQHATAVQGSTPAPADAFCRRTRWLCVICGGLCMLIAGATVAEYTRIGLFDRSRVLATAPHDLETMTRLKKAIDNRWVVWHHGLLEVTGPTGGRGASRERAWLRSAVDRRWVRVISLPGGKVYLAPSRDLKIVEPRGIGHVIRMGSNQ